MTPIKNAISISARAIKKGGVLLASSPADPTMLISIWDNHPYAVFTDNFTYGQIRPQNEKRGLFYEEPEILVDLDTRIDGFSKQECVGLLILSEGQLSVSAQPMNGNLSEPQLVPLWAASNFEAEMYTVGFKNWGIGISVGNEYRMISEFECKDIR